MLKTELKLVETPEVEEAREFLTLVRTENRLRIVQHHQRKISNLIRLERYSEAADCAQNLELVIGEWE